MKWTNGSKQYINRELSWLDFNWRVLEEAQDAELPVMERLKFIAITTSNLDEFFMVRVAGLLDQIAVGYDKKDPAGLGPGQQLEKISVVTHDMMDQLYDCLTEELLAKLEQEDIRFLKYNQVSEEQRQYLDEYFGEVVYPILTPMAIDNSRPFPLLSNKSLSVAVRVVYDEEDRFAVIQVPTVVDRIIKLPGSGYDHILLEDLITARVTDLFSGYETQDAHTFRITRNGDLAIDEDEAEDLLIEIEKSIKQRKWGAPVRMEYDQDMPKDMVKYLQKRLDLHKDDLYKVNGPLDPNIWMKFCFDNRFKHLQKESMRPNEVADFIGYGNDVFTAIRDKDILMHHPYDSFDPVIRFVEQAASDPAVLAIKQTLYRVSANSPIIKALVKAAENGKQVTVLVELKARFDEENNIIWAKRLERAGCHVIYGLTGLKIHCKTILVVREESDGIRRYVHMGTGNYNDSTAKLYTDLSMFTCRRTFGADISSLFNLLTGYAKEPNWKKIAVAPGNLRSSFIRSIETEIANKKRGTPARIICQMNSLVDEGIINKLYEASQAGVTIDLIIRGICCLRSGVEGLSENIRVCSIVGTFLEHPRIYYFHDGGRGRVYLSSADWMPRNLDRRVEVMFPVVSEELCQEVIKILEITLKDTSKMRVQQPSGAYIRHEERHTAPFESQVAFHKRTMERVRKVKKNLR